MGIRSILSGSVLAIALTSAGGAWATPEFPGLIQAFVMSTETPPCTICHLNDSGGLGTVIHPFGIYMQSRGLMPYDDGSLQTALQADQGEMHESDTASGITDIQALSMNEDPNDPVSADGGGGGAAAEPAPPVYGCGAHVAPTTGAARTKGLAALAVLLGMAVGRLSRRRRG